MPPGIVTSRTRSAYERPPQGPWVLNRGSAQAVGLVAWWPLGAIHQGGFLDYSGNNHPLTQAGTMAGGLVPRGGYGYGVANSANAANYLNIGTAIITTLPLTMNGWIYLRDSTDYGTCSALFAVTSPGGANYKCIQYDGANANGVGTHIAFLDQSGAAQASWASTTTVGAAGTVNMITGVVGGTAAGSSAVYLNAGGRNANAGTTNAPSGWSQTVVAAYRDTATFTPLSGVQLHTCLWNRAMTAPEVWQLYDPATRWELYYPTGRRAYSFAPPSAPADAVWFGDPNAAPASTARPTEMVCLY